MTTEESAPASSSKESQHKPMIKRPVRPDFDERDKKVSKLQDKRAEFQRRSKEITKRLDDILNANKSNNKLESLKRNLADVRYLKQQEQKRRDDAIEKLNAFSAVGTASKSAVKKSITVASADDIVDAINRVGASMASMTDAEEHRRAQEQISKLQASYEQLMGGKAGDAQGHAERLRSDLESVVKGCKEELQKLSAKEDALREQLDTMRSEQSATEPDIKALKAEREQCNEIADELWNKIVEIREDWQRRFEEFKVNMDAWRAEQAEVRKLRNADREEEQKQRNADRKERDLETKGAPFMTEIIRCEQLLVWCKQYEKREVAQVSMQSASTPQALDGMVVMSKKNIEDDDAFSGLSKSKNKKKNGKKAGAAVPGEGKAAQQKIQIDIEALGMFSKLRLPIPGTVADIPALVEKVEAAKEEYLSKQKRALAGEVFEPEAEEVQPAPAGPNHVKGTVSVDLRCDEAFGTVLLELCAH